MLREFREFAMRGNVVDMAVGVILGASFGKIVTSFVNDVIMPPIGLLVGKVDFSQLFVSLGSGAYATLEEAQKAGAPVLKYGVFLNTIFDFLIVAFAIFMVIRQMNRLKRPQAPAAPTTRDCPLCLSSVPLKATRCAHCTAEIKAA